MAVNEGTRQAGEERLRRHGLRLRECPYPYPEEPKDNLHDRSRAQAGSSLKRAFHSYSTGVNDWVRDQSVRAAAFALCRLGWSERGGTFLAEGPGWAGRVRQAPAGTRPCFGWAKIRGSGQEATTSSNLTATASASSAGCCSSSTEEGISPIAQTALPASATAWEEETYESTRHRLPGALRARRPELMYPHMVWVRRVRGLQHSGYRRLRSKGASGHR